MNWISPERISLMQLSIDLAQQIISMMLMASVGFLLSRLHVVSGDQSRSLSCVCVYAVLPAAFVSCFQYDLTADRLQGLGISMIAAVGIHAMYLVVLTLLKHSPIQLTNEEQCCVIYNNSGNLIIPMLCGMASLGESYIFYTCAYIAVQNLLVWSHGQSLMGGKPSLKKILLNPCMIGIFVGILLFFFQIRLTGPVATAVNGLSSCMGPLAMLIIGMMLGDRDLKAIFSDRRIYLVSFIRLIFFPFLIILLLAVLVRLLSHPDLTNILTVSLLCAIGPSAATVTQQAQIYHNPHRTYVSAINAVTTLFCAVTMPVMVLIFQLLL